MNKRKRDPFAPTDADFDQVLEAWLMVSFARTCGTARRPTFAELKAAARRQAAKRVAGESLRELQRLCESTPKGVGPGYWAHIAAYDAADKLHDEAMHVGYGAPLTHRRMALPRRYRERKGVAG